MNIGINSRMLNKKMFNNTPEDIEGLAIFNLDCLTNAISRKADKTELTKYLSKSFYSLIQLGNLYNIPDNEIEKYIIEEQYNEE